MTKQFATALLLAGSLGAAGMSFAQSGSTMVVDESLTTNIGIVEVRSMSVRYDASEMNDPKSAQKLFFRIRQAAEEVCRLSSHPRGYEIWEERACESEAVAEAIELADIPELDEYYANR